MTGAFLNALGILLGALFGLVWRGGLSRRTQDFVRSGIAASAAFLGLRLVWENLRGPLPACVRQLSIAVLSIVLGTLLGRLMHWQRFSNSLGRRAGGIVFAAQSQPPGPLGNGLTAVTVLLCAAPLGLVGVVTDGVFGFYQLLALKGVMDGLAMAGFVKLFRWPIALAALPVFIFMDALATAVQLAARPWLETHALTGAVGITAGLLVGVMALVILEVRRVELANYLPSLAVAPLVAWFFT